MGVLSPIDITGFRAQDLRDQAAPQLLRVDVSDLVVDRSYQRDISSAGKTSIRKIAANFDWAKFGPVLLAPVAGGKFAIVDGQHRAHAAAVCGITEIPAMVVPMSAQQQASAFSAVNAARVTINRCALYRASLAAGEDWAIACRAAVEAAGVVLATSLPTSGARKPKVVYCIGLIRKMVDGGEADAVTAGLRGVARSLQAEDTRPWDGGILGVWLPAVATNVRFLKLNLADCFDAIDIDAITDESRQRARLSGGTARQMTIARVVSELRDAL